MPLHLHLKLLPTKKRYRESQQHITMKGYQFEKLSICVRMLFVIIQSVHTRYKAKS